MLFLFFLILTVGAQDDDYFEELNPSKFKIFGPFRDPQIRIASTTETPSLDNETASGGNRTRDEFILGETLTAENHANSFGLPATQSTTNYQCGCPAVSQCVIPQPCTCAAPRPVCVPRPPPLCKFKILANKINYLRSPASSSVSLSASCLSQTRSMPSVHPNPNSTSALYLSTNLFSSIAGKGQIIVEKS